LNGLQVIGRGTGKESTFTIFCLRFEVVFRPQRPDACVRADKSACWRLYLIMIDDVVKSPIYCVEWFDRTLGGCPTIEESTAKAVVASHFATNPRCIVPTMRLEFGANWASRPTFS